MRPNNALVAVDISRQVLKVNSPIYGSSDTIAKKTVLQELSTGASGIFYVLIASSN